MSTPPQISENRMYMHTLFSTDALAYMLTGYITDETEAEAF